MTVNLSDIKLVPNLESVCREKISDSIYFSEKYADYISNSRLKLIDPDTLGSPSLYKLGLQDYTTSSLILGTCIHLGILQPEELNLINCPIKITPKLKLVVERIYKLRKKELPIYSCIIQACEEVRYYENKLTPSRIKTILQSGWNYYKFLNKTNFDDSSIILTTNDYNTVLDCIQNVNNNRQIQRLLHPIDFFEDQLTSYNEDTFFINVNGFYKDKTCLLKLKMKADNWTIDVENKVITLNDLKTTSHGINKFMEKSFNKYGYSRQFSFYLWILLQYCKKNYGYNCDEWTVKCNVIVVETNTNHSTQIFSIDKDILEKGRKEFCRLLKMVAYCEMTEYSDNIIFV